MQYRVESHTLTQPRTGLHSLANRYVPHDSRPDGLTLVFAHSTSNHKEQWEVVISRVFELFPGRLNEMWAIDWQSHGQSAVVNESALVGRVVTVGDYAEILTHFLESPHVAGKQIIAVGHSISTCAWTFAVFQLTLRVSPIVGLILFEPVHILPPIAADDDRILRGQANYSRRSTFPSREVAAQWARRRMPWKTWDERVFKCYMSGSPEVTTSCDTSQEMWQYKAHVPRPEMYSSAIRSGFYDGQQGRTPVKHQVIPGTGHLLVQEKPDAAAEVVVNILQQMMKRPSHL
ncbi:Alpha/beta hydrolase fold-1 [Mycena filopes]|nr:Alpha/beta hydrolase fold-1 [Mycena filopes]